MQCVTFCFSFNISQAVMHCAKQVFVLFHCAPVGQQRRLDHVHGVLQSWAVTGTGDQGSDGPLTGVSPHRRHKTGCQAPAAADVTAGIR